MSSRFGTTVLKFHPLLIVAAAAACLPGCGSGKLPTYPVTGKVTFENGHPLTTGGIVLCESLDVQSDGVPVVARGKIEKDGTFELFTFEEGDGVVAGKHRVLVRAQRDEDDYLKRGIVPRPVIDERFEDYETSGLELTVEEDDNDFPIVVTPPERTIERRLPNE